MPPKTQQTFQKLINMRENLFVELMHHISAATKDEEEPCSLTIIKHRHEQLVAAHDAFSKNKRELSGQTNLMQEAAVQKFRKENNELADMYIIALSHLDDQLVTDESLRDDQSVVTNEGYAKPQIKLPPIVFRKFSRDFSEWEEFRDMFNSCMDQQGSRIPDCQKILYLKSSLEGEPLGLIKQLRAAEGSYAAAWDILERRYNNTKRIFGSHFNAILDLPNLKRESVADLKKVLDITSSSMASFELLGIEINEIKPFIAHILIMKLDETTMKHWAEESKGSNGLPDLDQFVEFLEIRIALLDSFAHRSAFNHKEHKQSSGAKTFMAKQEKKHKCSICMGEHRPFECESFTKQSIRQRTETIAKKGLCSNCLYKHDIQDCWSRFRCSKCKRKHHSLLHEENEQEQATSTNTNTQLTKPSSKPSANQNLNKTDPFTGFATYKAKSMLATAIIPVENHDGTICHLRALLDQGSQSNLISESAVQKLRLKKHPVNVTISSISESTTSVAKFKVALNMGSLYMPNYRYKLEALVISSVTKISPVHNERHFQCWDHIHGLELADPSHLKAGSIDILIGAEAYAEVILPGLRKGPKGTPIAQQTKLGWILSGSTNLLPDSGEQTSFECNLASLNEPIECTQNTPLPCHSINPTPPNIQIIESMHLMEALKKFWELEEDLAKTHWTDEEKECVRKFKEETSIGPDGKFIVRLPFKIPISSDDFLANNYKQARARYEQMETRLARSPEKFKQYHDGIEEALGLGHLRYATPDEIKDTINAYFMPQHIVYKETSTTTKARIVFDASAKTPNGFSLNDRLMVGPVIQNDLFTILANWRLYEIGFTADICQMYKQVWVHQDDAKFQRILYRPNPNTELCQLISQTLTFGTANAAYQATESINETAEQNMVEFPEESESLKSNTYIDDKMDGAHSVVKAIQKYDNTMQITAARGFHLRKWCSSSKQFLEHIPIEFRENKSQDDENNEFVIKALGIKWQPESDTFKYTIAPFDDTQIVTKRKFLSDVCKLFDPLGWLSPITIKLKIWIQHLWIKGTGWDHAIPEELRKAWLQFRAELKSIETLRIRRWVEYSPSKSVSLQAFCDASVNAYACAIYVRMESSDGGIQCNLLAAKTRVAPLKKISIAKLELCSAALLCKTLKRVKIALKIPEIPVYAWSDSMIALAWISSHPSRWKTFVANRVAEIQQDLNAEHWNHVASEFNAADVASRGIYPDELHGNEQWWHGPQFLKKPITDWGLKSQPVQCTQEEEQKERAIFQINVDTEHPINIIMHKFQSLIQATRITAYCKRIFRPKSGLNLNTDELKMAQCALIKYTQKEYFPNELHALKQGKCVATTSTLRSFLPFLDDQGLLRVRGRIQESMLDEDAKHPVILPSKGRLTYLIIDHAQKKCLHGGTQVTMQFTRQRFWILKTRNTIKNQISKCVRCHRKKKAQHQIMGNLPIPRVRQSIPFTQCGVDFAGYFEVKTSIRRNAPFAKCYVSLFVCLSTKAIHLELVHDLTTEAFMQAFIRFSSRRGRPSDIFSDCGTNFIGASSELPQLLLDAKTEIANYVSNKLISEGTQWHFIPPRAPHFGGLWEAGVKSTKHHIKRTIGDNRLTYEDFNTLLTQIEAVLNSRPLCPLTEDPNDLSVLTPGHFLVGRPITTISEPSLLDIKENRLSRYQRIQRLFQGFWKRWSEEYLQRLQQRPKWKVKSY